MKRDGAERASRVTGTKAEAEKIGRQISRNQETKLQVHRKGMTIERSNSQGTDPNPPRTRSSPRPELSITAAAAREPRLAGCSGEDLASTHRSFTALEDDAQFLEMDVALQIVEHLVFYLRR